MHHSLSTAAFQRGRHGDMPGRRIRGAGTGCRRPTSRPLVESTWYSRRGIGISLSARTTKPAFSGCAGGDPTCAATGGGVGRADQSSRSHWVFCRRTSGVHGRNIAGLGRAGPLRRGGVSAVPAGFCRVGLSRYLHGCPGRCRVPLESTGAGSFPRTNRGLLHRPAGDQEHASGIFSACPGRYGGCRGKQPEISCILAGAGNSVCLPPDGIRRAWVGIWRTVVGGVAGAGAELAARTTPDCFNHGR